MSTALSTLNLYLAEIQEEEKRIEATGSLSDHDLALALMVFRGNMAAIAKKLDINFDKLRERVKSSPILKGIIENSKAKFLDQVWDQYSDAIISGNLTHVEYIEEVNEKGRKTGKVTTEIGRKRLDGPTRMWHMKELLKGRAKEMGLQEPEESTIGTQNNYKIVNVFDINNLDEFKKILKLDQDGGDFVQQPEQP